MSGYDLEELILKTFFAIMLLSLCLKPHLAPPTVSTFQKVVKASKEEESCPEPIYQNAKELSRRVAIKSKPQPSYTEEARKNSLKGRVVLKVVLCKSGKVTDIRVLEGLPFGMTEKVIKAARKIQFIPAEKDGLAVSQRLQVEYYFNLQ